AIDFLCHSLGGLVVKAAFLEALTSPSTDVQSLLSAVRGIVFFGTPHQGASKTTIGSLSAKFGRWWFRNPPNSLLEALKPDSIYAADLHRRFLHAARNLSIVCVFETLPYRVGIVKAVIVEPKSAVLDLENEISISRDCDHRNVCIFQERNTIYQQIIERLQAFSTSKKLVLTTGGSRALLLAQMLPTLSGVGRTKTWIGILSEDVELLWRLGVIVEDMKLRKGILEPAALSNRWCKKARFLHNGVKTETRTKPVNEAGIFTWMMVLIYATLHVSHSKKVAEQIMDEFVIMDVNEDMIADLLQRNLPQHRGGWLSMAQARGIESAAQVEWNRLEDEGWHPAGLIPASDKDNVLALLSWIALGSARSFNMSSGDVYCVALILSKLGFCSLRTTIAPQTSSGSAAAAEPEEVLESEMQLYYNKNPMGAISQQEENSKSKRKGMRLPLAQISNVVMVWPGDSKERKSLAEALNFGYKSGSRVHFELEIEYATRHGTSVGHISRKRTGDDIRFLDGPAVGEVLERDALSLFVQGYFGFSTDSLWENMVRTFQEWEREMVSWITKRGKLFVAHLQCAVMGYCYGSLMPLVDDSQLSTKEVYGGWGWVDTQVLAIAHDLWGDRPTRAQGGRLLYPVSKTKLAFRFEILKAISYFK
ncbi:hypothetical protein QBC38DRAFT_521744, partial [Podospora fimiseda]